MPAAGARMLSAKPSQNINMRMIIEAAISALHQPANDALCLSVCRGTYSHKEKINPQIDQEHTEPLHASEKQALACCGAEQRRSQPSGHVPQ